ncbi:MAG: hypothetical protein KGY70_16235 [Bacteroidales bacterium]|nr:hypothetical protein [Bacteroidales bacterium]
MKTKTKQQATENRISQVFENEVLNAREMLLIKGGDANDTDDNSGGSDDQQDGFN